MLFSAIISGDQKERQKVRALQAARCCEPSRGGCWRDRVARPGSQCSAGNAPQAPETHAAGLKFGEDKTEKSSNRCLKRERGEGIRLGLRE